MKRRDARRAARVEGERGLRHGRGEHASIDDENIHRRSIGQRKEVAVDTTDDATTLRQIGEHRRRLDATGGAVGAFDGDGGQAPTEIDLEDVDRPWTGRRVDVATHDAACDDLRVARVGDERKRRQWRGGESRRAGYRRDAEENPEHPDRRFHRFESR